ncbi:MAG: DUF58 domain-containing protein [Armatimonadetes bacterium]|nr:DUF58 domain-containing protein [Armatimonadota bacterium]MBX3107928.1 DUF58 domain-containing protein [Fimbriimonadaceae bacterium]
MSLSAPSPHLDTRDVRVLERLRLKPRKAFSGRVRGERLAREKGVSLEFKDYREYSDGDDLRHIDWNVLARLGTPIVKTYQDEEDLPVTLLVDASESMDFGEPNKFGTACQLAAAFGVVAARGGDSVQGVALADTPNRIRFLRGRRGTISLTSWLESLRPNGKRALAFHLKQAARHMSRPGLAILITDGMDPSLAQAFAHVTVAGHELWVVQVLSPFELDPGIEGDLRMIDAETNQVVEITANGPTLDAYRRNLANHNSAIEQAALKHGGRYALIESGKPLAEVFGKTFQKTGWVG